MIARPNLARALVLCVLTLGLFSGCTRVKKLIHEGFNRDEWQKPSEVIAHLDLKTGNMIGEIRAGSGYFTLPLSRAVGPEGRVYALDTDGQALTELEARAKSRQLKNIETVRVVGAEPGLPPVALDLIFICNAYAGLENREQYFADLRNHLKPKGRVVIVEFNPEGFFSDLLSEPIEKKTIAGELAKAGFRLEQDLDFLSRQSFQSFTAD